MNNKKLKILGVTLVGMIFLLSCSPLSEANKNPAAETTPTPCNTTESPYLKYTPTTAETAVATLFPTPMRPDMAGSAYSSEQQSLIENGTFKDTEQALTAWFIYWENASNNPFQTETTGIHFKYVFDNTGKTAGVCLESIAYPGVCFALPIVNGEVANIPSTVTGEYIVPVGYGPLELSDQLTADQVSALKLDESLTNSVLDFDNGSWVRVKNGEVVATLDLVSAQWVKKEAPVDANFTQWDEAELNIGGNPVEFLIGKENDADLTNKWNLQGIDINKSLVDYQKKFSTMLGASFWQVYVTQSRNDVSYEDFLKDPQKYPINIVSPDSKGGYKSTIFTLEQMKKFEWRFINRADNRLYFTDPVVNKDSINGYDITSDGTFILYDTWPETENSLDIIFSDGYPAKDVRDYAGGNIFGFTIIEKIYGIANTPELGSPEGVGSNQDDWVKAYKPVIELCNYPTIDEMKQITGGTTAVDGGKYLSEYGFWKLILK